jgi:hypothetical protein
VTTDWKLPWDGGCRCDRVRLQVTVTPLVSMICHCGGCQRMTGSAYSLTLIVPAAGFAVTAGDPVVGGLHGPHRQLYCPHCKSWIFTQGEGFEDFVNVRATMLDDHTWLTPFLEVCTSEALPWALTGAPHSYPGAPPDEHFDMLIADFAARSPRPA